MEQHVRVMETHVRQISAYLEYVHILQYQTEEPVRATDENVQMILAYLGSVHMYRLQTEQLVMTMGHNLLVREESVTVEHAFHRRLGIHALLRTAIHITAGDQVDWVDQYYYVTMIHVAPTVRLEVNANTRV